MRKLLLSKCDELYMQRHAEYSKLGYGLIIGQQVNAEMFIVICLSKTGEHYFEARDEEEDYPILEIQRIEQIDPHILAHQWTMALKMIPGCFKVLGLYVTSMQPDIFEQDSFNAAQRLLHDVHHLLLRSNQCYASVDHCCESQYAFLTYSYTTCQVLSRWYRHGQLACSFSPMISRFVGNSFPWVTFECNYKLNGAFPIYDRILNIEDPFEQAVDMVRNDLAFSEVLIDKQSVADETSLEMFLKSMEAAGKRYTGEQPLELTVYLPMECQSAEEDTVRESHCSGKVRFCGEISSRLWVHPQNLLGNVKRFVRDDIFRSLERRVQLYTNTKVNPTLRMDAVHETILPRRVYFNVTPNSLATDIQFSDYLFPDDALEETVIRAKRVLDLTILAEKIEDDVENLLIDDESNGARSRSSECSSSKLYHAVFMLGLVLCFLFFTASVILQTTVGDAVNY